MEENKDEGDGKREEMCMLERAQEASHGVLDNCSLRGRLEAASLREETQCSIL